MGSIVNAISGPDKGPLYAARGDARKRIQKGRADADKLSDRVNGLLDRDKSLLAQLRTLLGDRRDDVNAYRREVARENRRQTEIRERGGAFRQLAYREDQGDGVAAGATTIEGGRQGALAEGGRRTTDDAVPAGALQSRRRGLRVPGRKTPSPAGDGGGNGKAGGAISAADLLARMKQRKGFLSVSPRDLK